MDDKEKDNKDNNDETVDTDDSVNKSDTTTNDDNDDNNNDNDNNNDTTPSPIDIERLVAEAEQRGYLRGRNEAVKLEMERPGIWEQPRGPENFDSFLSHLD